MYTRMKRSRANTESVKNHVLGEEIVIDPLIVTTEKSVSNEWPSPNDPSDPTISLDSNAQSFFRLDNFVTTIKSSKSHRLVKQKSKKELDYESSDADSEELNRRKLRNLREKSRAQKVKDKINTLSELLKSRNVNIGKSKHSVLDATITYICDLELKLEHFRSLGT